jgi:hypothetical protein
MAVEEVFSNAEFCLRYSGKIAYAGWFAAPRLEYMLMVERLSNTHRGELALANIIVAGKATFTEDVREAGIRMTRKHAFSRGAAHLVLVDGLKGSAVKAFLSMVMLVGRAPAKTKVFSDTALASRFLAALVKTTEASEVEALIKRTAANQP